MRSNIIDEAVSVLGIILDELLTTYYDGSTRAAADLRRAVGDLMADREAAIVYGRLATPLQACFDQARVAGADLASLKRLRTLIVAQQPIGLPAVVVVQGCLRFCLSQETRVLAVMEYTSRDQVEAIMVIMREAFAVAEEYAADQKSVVTYRALVALRAATIHHLLTQARPLPRMVTRTFARTQPVLTLANRLYGDAARYQELLRENRTPHPLFMGPAIRALAV